MKKLICMILLCITITAQAQSPKWKEFFRQKKTQREYLIKQIAALKVQLAYIKKGYKIVDKGLTLIGDIKDGNFRLHQDYFNSLNQVNPVVKSSPKINAVINGQTHILNQFQKFIQESRHDPNLAEKEVNYITTVYTNILKSSNASIDELTMITTAGESQMKDDERLNRLDKIHDDMQEQYAFTQNFISTTRLLATARAKERHALNTVKKLFTP